MRVYLAGEIHSNWREEIIQLSEKEKLDITFTSPVTDHEASDNCGVEILGVEEKNFWKDRKGAGINSIRTKKAIKESDVIIVKFCLLYTSDAARRIERCRSRWSPYH